MTQLIITCPFCGKEYSITVPTIELEAYQRGELAQCAFKSLTPTERECIISQMCPDCQEKIFGSDEI